MRKLYIDLETRSRLSLPKVGAYRYAEHHSTEVHCLAWALDDGPVVLWKRSDDLVEEAHARAMADLRGEPAPTTDRECR